MNNSKVAIAVNKTAAMIQVLAGAFLVFFFGFGTILFLTEGDVASLVFCLVFDALGIWLILRSRKTTKLINDFRKYVTAISHDPTGFIPNIAASLGTSEDVVRKNLELMIKKNYFSNAYIDRNANCIVIASKQPARIPVAGPNVFANAYGNPVAPAVEMVAVKCNGCGGMNTIAKGQTGECDYCGSPIKGV